MQNQHFDMLIDSTKPIGVRYQAVFELKNIGTKQAIQSLIKAYPHCGSSILLKHQLLYALGQLPIQMYDFVKLFLIQKMEDESENNLSRHEAAEALANYFDVTIQEYYLKHINSSCKELQLTCEIAKEKLQHIELKEKYGKLYCGTMEPAAPFSKEEFEKFIQKNEYEELFKNKNFMGLLCCDQISLFHKYRILYYMRNINNKQCREILCQLLSKQFYQTQTSLLKHEVCFIIGQIGCEGFQHLIRECIENQDEEGIVRHEALAAVASQSKDPIYLEHFVNPAYQQLIRESAEVAIHTIKYWSE